MKENDIVEVDVEDVTIEELGEFAGADTSGTLGSTSTAGTPISTAATIGTMGSE